VRAWLRSVELVFEAESTGETYSPRSLKAATDFDARQQERAAAARRSLIELEFNPDAIDAGERFGNQVEEVFRNRYALPEAAALGPAAVGPKVRRRPKKVWRLETSCWAERKVLTDEFFESSEVMQVRRTASCPATRLDAALDATLDSRPESETGRDGLHTALGWPGLSSSGAVSPRPAVSSSPSAST
jgi:hypothetical protein